MKRSGKIIGMIVVLLMVLVTATGFPSVEICSRRITVKQLVIVDKIIGGFSENKTVQQQPFFRTGQQLSDFWLASIKISKTEFALAGKLESAPKKEIEVVSSGYYRPLKKQKKFAHGNYQKEIRVNGQGFHTWLGNRPRIGTVAADPRFFKPGTVLEIPGYGLGIVQDIGEAIKGKRIDLFMGEGEPALNRVTEWGMKKIQVKVFKERTLG